MYVIAGVTGHTGKTVADTLIAKGQPVRVLVRKPEQGEAWKARGAEVAVASLDDEAALARAFTGAKAAFVLIPPDPVSTDFLASRARMTESISRAITSSKLPHVVLLSSIGAHIPKGTGPIAGLHHSERSFEKTGAATTFVRAAYFLENLAGVLPAAKNDGVLPTFLPAGLVHDVVTTADIGRTAAQALLDGPRGQRVIELSGPAATSANELAATLTKILGRPVKPAEAPLSALVPTFKSFGMSQHMAELYLEMNQAFISGLVAWEGKGERVRGQVSVEEGLRGLLG
jgi:uncharacterized protein YbjT (DUF2867 family)